MAPHQPDRREDIVSVQLPRSLWERIHAHVAGTSLQSVDEFVAYAVREVLAREDLGQPTGLSTEEEQRIKTRLKALGYLD